MLDKLKKGINHFLLWCTKNPWKAIILLIFIILSFYLKFHEISVGLGDEFVGSDPEAYHRYASDFYEKGQPLSSWHNPLQTIYLAIVYGIFGINMFIARFIQILASFLIPVFLYFFTKRFFGENAGYLAALIALVEYHIVYFSGHLWGELWMILFLSWMLYIYSKNCTESKVSWKAYVGIGVLGGLGALGKIWMIGVALVLAGFLIFHENKKKINFKLITKYYIKVVFVLFGLFVILLPWSAYTSYHEGYFIFVNQNSNLNLYIGNNPRGVVVMDSVYDWSHAYDTNIEAGNCRDLIQDTEHPLYKKYFNKCLGTYSKHYIFENPGLFINKLWRFTFEHWMFPNLSMYQRGIRDAGWLLFSQWTVWVLALIGFIASLKKWRVHLPFYLIILGIWISYAATVYLARYRISYVPIQIMYAAAGLWLLYNLVKGIFKK